jgi:hypothetical protein
MKPTLKYITKEEAQRLLVEHIIRGDAGDGIPNILSEDNSLVIGKRQTPVTQKKLDALIESDLFENPDHPNYRNFARNRQLIDLTQIPATVKQQIMESYSQQANKKSNNLLNYFIANKLKNLTDSIGEFV